MELEIRNTKSKMIGARLTEEQYKEVKQLSKLNGVSISEMCRALIEGALKELKNG